MTVKKQKIKKRNSIERVYKNGREAIVKAVKRKAAHRKPSVAVIEPSCAIKEYKSAPNITINEYELPSYNDTTRITLIAKDPFWLYAYWEIAESSIENVKKQLGGNLDGTRFVVRMYDVTYKDFNGFNANHWFDIEVGRYSNNWYISLWNDNVSYCADLGIVHASGRFFPMARSNFVHTPRSNSSNRFEEIWMDITHEQELSGAPMPYNKVEGAACPESLDFARDKLRRGVQYDTAGRFNYSSLSKKRKIYLNEADLRAYYSKLSPLLRDRILSRVSRKKIYRYLYSKMSGTEWQDLLYFRRLHEAKFGRKIMIGASEFTYLGGSENLQGGASEFAQKPDKKRKFFFEIGTELIVYGRTEPDAEVKLGDKKVDLKPDGTFSMRLALPDGKIPLPFIATSKDKIDTRKITTQVERNTSYA
ncbi:MAG: hypothetical protein A2047_01760 [Omnitrophica bacterium GWA2_41_15]|nr:MAG: hypothetical protein A2047_01760 [Omnitrophica bacterium GWA2_41_15]HAZ09886.1 hypothetical protein [Candidatus Omnitrophota bacterium]